MNNNLTVEQKSIFTRNKFVYKIDFSSNETDATNKP